MIARQSLLMVSTQMFVRFLGWIGLVVLAKLWGGFAPEATGVIGFAMAFLGIFNIISNLGFNDAHVKKISEGQDLGRCIGTFITIKVVLNIIMVSSIFLFIFLWKNFFGGGFIDATTESVVYVFVLYYVVLNLQYIPQFTFQGTQEIAKRQLAQIFEGLVKSPLEILVAVAGVSITGVAIAPAFGWPDFLEPLRFYLSQHPQGSFAMTYVFGAAGPLLIGIFLLRKYPLKKPTKQLLKSYALFALPLSIISVMGVISTNIDKIMIGYFWASSEVGYYFTLQQILQLLSIIFGSVGMALFPSFSKHHSQKNYAQIKKTALLGERYLSMIMIPPIVVLVVYSAPVISIMLSNSFLPGVSTLMILAVMNYFRAQNNYLRALISGVNAPKTLVWTSLATVVSNVILNIALIPEQGLLSSFGIAGASGASVATLISTALCFFYMKYFAKKLISIPVFQKEYFFHIAAGIVMGGFLLFVNQFIASYSWYVLFFMSILGLGVYLGVLRLLKEFKKDDFDFFMDVFNIRQMIGYIKSDLNKRNEK